MVWLAGSMAATLSPLAKRGLAPSGRHTSATVPDRSISGTQVALRMKGGTSTIWKMAPGLSPAKLVLMSSHSSGVGTSLGSGTGGGRVGVGRVVRERTSEGRPRLEKAQAREEAIVVMVVVVVFVMLVMSTWW